MSGNYPAGVTDNDPEFDMPSAPQTGDRMEKAMNSDPSRPGIFRDHNCWKCRDGELPCVNREPRRCDYPHARND